MKPRDTSQQAWEVLIDIYRKMPASTKIRCIFDAYRTGKELAMAGLRFRHPEASNKQIWNLWAKQHLGEKLFEEVYGNTANE